MSGSTAIRVEEDFSAQGGYALVRIPGAAAAVTAPAFQLLRLGWADPSLGENGWQGGDALLQPESARADGGDLVLRIGPNLCDHLPAATYQFRLPAAGIDTAVVWPDISPVYGGSSGVFPGQGIPQTQEIRQTGGGTGGPQEGSQGGPQEDPSQDHLLDQGHLQGHLQGQVRRDGPETPKPHGPTRLIWLVAALVLLLAAAGGAGWWWVSRDRPAPPIAPPPAAQSQSQPQSPPQSPTDLDSLSVQALIQRNNPAEMQAQAERRMAGKPNEAMLLLEAAGDDRHFGPSLANLARLYDPGKPRQAGISADARQAARYYREAQAAGQPVEADRAALRSFLEGRAQAGDVTAKLVLQDFWQ